MKLKRLTHDHYVCDQLRVDDFDELASQGIRSVINNRPDGEAEDQPTSRTLERAATAAGLEYRHAPIVSQQLTRAEIEANRRAFAAVTRPLCAFCRTGTRAAVVWGLIAAESERAANVLEAVAAVELPTDALAQQLCDSNMTRTET